jgi:hypothetical protein
MGSRTRAAVERRLREGGVIGSAWLFPSPRDPSKPLRRELAAAWLAEAERLAEVEPLRGSAWHAFRRKWATEREHLPRKDAMAAGGWKSVEAFEVYTQADFEGVLRAVMEPRRLREAR